jgi:hypothetical protein
MKPKPCIDPDFHANSRRWYWPVRSIGQLMIVVALSAVALALMAGRAPRQVPRKRVFPRFSRNATVFQRPGQGPQARVLVERPRDPFVMVAPAGIDREMIVPAPAEIDEAMVFHPKTGDQPQVLTAPPLNPVVVPEPGQEPIPVPHGSSPHEGAPPLPGPAQPR